jgi:hypothetical protein
VVTVNLLRSWLDSLTVVGASCSRSPFASGSVGDWSSVSFGVLGVAEVVGDGEAVGDWFRREDMV